MIDRLEPWEDVFISGKNLGWDDIGRIVASGMVVEFVLLPFAKLSAVRPYIY